ncbi:hypothetical protein D3C72_2223680 [compost metagenome]
MLHITNPGGDDQRLPQGMAVPSGTRAGFEGHRAAADARRQITLEQAINAYRAGEIFRCALDRGLCAILGDADFAGGLGFRAQ